MKRVAESFNADRKQYSTPDGASKKSRSLRRLLTQTGTKVTVTAVLMAQDDAE